MDETPKEKMPSVPVHAAQKDKMEKETIAPIRSVLMKGATRHEGTSDRSRLAAARRLALSQYGAEVTLYEMKPKRFSPAHHSSDSVSLSVPIPCGR
jgi:hypothetical protein